MRQRYAYTITDESSGKVTYMGASPFGDGKILPVKPPTPLEEVTWAAEQFITELGYAPAFGPLLAGDVCVQSTLAELTKAIHRAKGTD